MSKPVLLWFDCCSALHQPDLQSRAAKYFDVVAGNIERADEEIARVQPSAMCFDFDHPDENPLRVLQAVKQRHPALPILMLTVEHSEALAVWAFRTRVWNYLVKPVATAELIDNLLSLTRVLAQARRPSSPMLAPSMPGLPGRVATDRRSSPHDVLAPAIQYIEQHYDQVLSANDLARLCGRNRFQFSRLFHRTFGITFQQYVLRHRISEACRLLRKPGASVTQVGYSVGFNDGSYFARIFKRYTGVLPSRYAAGHTATMDFAAPSPELSRLQPESRPGDAPDKGAASQD